MMVGHRTRIRRWTAVTAVVALAFLAGCTVNPATGKRQITLISEPYPQSVKTLRFRNSPSQ